MLYLETKEILSPFLLPEGMDPASCMFFDIETTGLSPEVSSLYLIGALYQREGEFYFSQWFADDYESEKAILISFGELMQSYSVIVHYNGDRFDLPYLESKWKKYQLPYSFESLCSLDYYLRIRPFKALLQTTSLSLRTMSSLLHIKREDPYDGKELIARYGDYLKAHFTGETEEALLSDLLLHNREDVMALPRLTCLEAYPALYEGRFEKIEGREEPDAVQFTARLFLPLPLPFEQREEHFTLSGDGGNLCLRLPLFRGVMKHYFSDYKNYYYLPLEDQAIHKSVGQFVEKAYREQATASTCYQKKEGVFLPAPAHLKLSGQTHPLFHLQKKSDPAYLLYAPDLLQNTALQKKYFEWALEVALSPKKAVKKSEE